MVMPKPPKGWQGSLNLKGVHCFDVLRDHSTSVDHFKVEAGEPDLFGRIRVLWYIHFRDKIVRCGNSANGYVFRIDSQVRMDNFYVYNSIEGRLIASFKIKGVRLCKRKANQRHYNKTNEPL